MLEVSHAESGRKTKEAGTASCADKLTTASKQAARIAVSQSEVWEF